MLRRTYLKKKSSNPRKRKLAIAKTLYNKWVRIFNSNGQGYCKCVTCGKVMFWVGGDCQAGHFVHQLDFISDNQHTQCLRCNHHLSGNLIEYTKFMIDKYGEERVNYLRFEGKRAHKYSEGDLDIMIVAYRASVKQELEKRGLA